MQANMMIWEMILFMCFVVTHADHCHGLILQPVYIVLVFHIEPCLRLCLRQVIERIDRFLDSAGAHSQVVLVPSIRDIHHHAVFPQPPLALDRLGSRHPQAYTCLPNPAIFSCNEVTVGVVTSDVLKHLSGQEVQRGPLGDRLPSLAGHLLGQQR